MHMLDGIDIHRDLKLTNALSQYLYNKSTELVHFRNNNFNKHATIRFLQANFTHLSFEHVLHNRLSSELLN